MRIIMGKEIPTAYTYYWCCYAVKGPVRNNYIPKPSKNWLSKNVIKKLRRLIFCFVFQDQIRKERKNQ